MTAVQDGPDTVVVTWTAPTIARYQVQVTVGAMTTTTEVTGTSLTISASQFGVYSIQVISLSRHFPGETSAPVHVTVRGREYHII